MTTIDKFMSVVWILWFISEMYLSKRTHVKSEKPNPWDKSSILVVLTTVYISVGLSVFFGTSKIGFIKPYHEIISVLGIFLVFLGLIIRWTAVFTLKKYFTTRVMIHSDHRVIQEGIYKYIRHPSYAGSLLSFLGMGMYFSNWVSILVLIVPLCIAFMDRIRVEEKALIEALGDNYIEYAKHTKRFIPHVL
jgi:protein-S-isoprenylcysteine O-methyltransferase Ste14